MSARINSLPIRPERVMSERKQRVAQAYLESLYTGDDTASFPERERESTVAVPRNLADEKIFDGPELPILGAGERFGPFMIKGLLGSGGVANVYRASDRMDADVAIKVPRIASPWINDLIGREFRLTRSIADRGVVEVQGLYNVDNIHVISQELIEGTSIDKWVRQGIPTGQLPSLDRVYSAIAQLAQALDSLHEQNYVHRDIKPNNVLVDGSGRVKLIDFGLATRIRTLGNWSNPEFQLGTFRYLAPEIALSCCQTTASDIYSFGRVLFYLLAGRLPCLDLPLQPDWSDARIASQLNQQLPCGTPSDLVNLCIGTNAFDPDQRPSAEEITDYLQSATSKRKRQQAATAECLQTKLRQTVKANSAKSGLVVLALEETQQAFLGDTMDALSGDDNYLVLKGQTCAGENLPYRAINPIVSELGQWLQNLDPCLRRAWPLMPDSPAIADWPILGLLASSHTRFAQATSLNGARETGLSDLAWLFQTLAEDRTIVLCIEHLQHADGASWQFLRQLQTVAEKHRVLIFASVDANDAVAMKQVQSMVSADNIHTI